MPWRVRLDTFIGDRRKQPRANSFVVAHARAAVYRIQGRSPVGAISEATTKTSLPCDYPKGRFSAVRVCGDFISAFSTSACTCAGGAETRPTTPLSGHEGYRSLTSPFSHFSRAHYGASRGRRPKI
ncbi:hypothetical protein MRX96_012004 [Rhipicephalus microplus]